VALGGGGGGVHGTAQHVIAVVHEAAAAT